MPDSAEIRYLAAQEAFRRPTSPRSRLTATPSQPLRGESPRVRMLLGMLEFSLGNNEKAIDHYRKGLAQVGGNDQQLTFDLARSLIKLNRLSEAKPLVSQFQRIEGKEPTPIAMFLNALYDQKAGHFSRAISNLKKAETKIPEGYKGELQLVLARCYLSLGEPNLAKMAYRSSITSTPWLTEARRELARLLLATNPQEAVLKMERRGAVAATTSRCSTTRADSSSPDRQPSRSPIAAGLDSRRFSTRPTRSLRASSASALRSDYLNARGKGDEAIRLLYEAINGSDRKNIDAWLILANRLVEQGRRDEALRVLEDATKDDAAGDHASDQDHLRGDPGPIGQGPASPRPPDSRPEPAPRRGAARPLPGPGELAREMGDRRPPAPPTWMGEARPLQHRPWIGLDGHRRTFRRRGGQPAGNRDAPGHRRRSRALRPGRPGPGVSSP